MPDDELEDGQRSGKSLREELEETRARNAELEKFAEEADDARRELAFTKAELGDSRAVGFFRDHYDGPLDAAAIRSAAIDAGVVDEVPPATQVAAQAQQIMAQTAQGSFDPPVPGGQEEMWREFEKAVSSGQPNAMVNGANVLRSYGWTGDGMEGPPRMSPSGAVPQTVPISDPRYSGTPIADL